MSSLDKMFEGNDVLKKYSRFVGTGGNKDYLEVFSDKGIKVGVKFALEPSYGGTKIVCRIRIVSSGKKDIFNVCQFAEKNYDEGMGKLTKFGMIKCSSLRASVAMIGENSLESLGNDLAVDGVKILKGFHAMWRSITKKAIDALKIITFGDKPSLEHLMRISNALNKVYVPDLPRQKEKAEVVDINSGNGDSEIDPPHPDEAKGKPEPKAKKAKAKPKTKPKAKTSALKKTKKDDSEGEATEKAEAMLGAETGNPDTDEK